VVPFYFISPYLAGAVVVDYLVWGRYPLGLKHPPVLTPGNMAPLTLPSASAQSSPGATTSMN
jgi:hypothetical protein